MGLIVIVAFWGTAIRLWIDDGPKTPLIFIAIWLAGLFGFPEVGWNSGYQFLAFEAILAVILIIIERYKNAT